MSKKKRPRRSPLGGYGNIARHKFPDYARGGAPCDVPECENTVDGDRTLTWVAEEGAPFSVYIRLCAAHMRAPIVELMKLLPHLAEFGSDTAYVDLRDEAGQ